MSKTNSIIGSVTDLLQSIDRPAIVTAFSGGPDSTVLLHALHYASRQLLSKGKNSPEIYAAHCNFRLRGEESQRDMDFAQRMTDSLEIPCFTIEFDTLSYCKENKLSVEMGARRLRHEWFRELCSEYNALLATGHNADDNAETMLLNMLRGSGVRGLKGMLPRQGNIIRPLLHFSREEIMQYIVENHLEYVTDSTNLSSDYRRNFLRNEIMPLLQSRWPGAKRGLATTLACLADDYAVIEQAVSHSLPARHDILTWETLREFAAPRLLLLRHFGPYGLTPDIAREIEHHIPCPRPGAVWHIHETAYHPYIIRATSKGLSLSASYHQDENNEEKGFNPDMDGSANERFVWSEQMDVNDANIAIVRQLPLSECALPRDKEHYIWCKPDKGMRIRPLGMHGSKRVSDVIREACLTSSATENILILCRRSDYVPIWIPGIKRAAADLITPESESIYIIRPV